MSTFTKDANGETDLMKAADVGDLTYVIHALSNDSTPEYVNAQNNYGNTALMLAANHDHFFVATQLIANGADVHLQNSVGQTAVLMADRQDLTDVVELLVSHGAEPPPAKPVVEPPPEPVETVLEDVQVDVSGQEVPTE